MGTRAYLLTTGTFLSLAFPLRRLVLAESLKCPVQILFQYHHIDLFTHSTVGCVCAALCIDSSCYMLNRWLPVDKGGGEGAQAQTKSAGEGTE